MNEIKPQKWYVSKLYKEMIIYIEKIEENFIVGYGITALGNKKNSSNAWFLNNMNNANKELKLATPEQIKKYHEY